MTKDEIVRKYATPDEIIVLVTEVTRMSRGVDCGAGRNVEPQTMVRPLQTDGSNWQLGSNRRVFGVGHLIHCRPSGARGPTMPHSSEDTRLHGTPSLLEELSDDAVHALVLPSAAPSVAKAIGLPLIENKYVEEGARCRSLGGVRVGRRQIQFRDDWGKLRLSIAEPDGTSYDLKVTSDWLQHLFSPSDEEAEPHFGVNEGNEWLDANGEKDVIVLRVGLARPWDGRENRWRPKRCYLQLNGIICPTDNYHIFSGPPNGP